MTPTLYQLPVLPPAARPLYDSPEAAEAARQSRADVEAGLRQRREQKAAETAEKRETQAQAAGFASADDRTAAIRKTAEGYAKSRYSRPR